MSSTDGWGPITVITLKVWKYEIPSTVQTEPNLMGKVKLPMQVL